MKLKSILTNSIYWGLVVYTVVTIVLTEFFQVSYDEVYNIFYFGLTCIVVELIKQIIVKVFLKKKLRAKD